MDLPGPSSSTNNIIRPISTFYEQPMPQLIPQVTPPLITNLPLFYPNLFQQVPSVKTQYLERSEISAFKEVSDLKHAVDLIFPYIPLFVQQQQQTNLMPTTPDVISLVSQIAQMRKLRPLAGNSTTSAQPECPIAMRTLNGATHQVPGSLIFGNFYNNMPLSTPSPSSLPNGSLQLPLGAEAQQVVQSVEEQAVKWSSPSSVDSNGQKTDSSTVSAADSQTIDIVGDGSESSSTSSASAHDPIQSLYQSFQSIQSAVANHKVHALASVLNPDNKAFYPTVSQPDLTAAAARVAQLPSSSTGKTSGIGPERKPRKPVNDDIVKIVRQQDLSAEAVAAIEIPVPKAVESDPTFRPVSEQQIIQQIIQGKKYEEMETGECMIQLCKKLAEKRVFGPRLMSQTTVAGLNHSNYSNLPIKGICYIQHVCWKVLRDKFDHDEDFWDKFREAMRKLAARCRRVRHAKKTKHNREESLAQQQLSKQYTSMDSNLQALGLAALCSKPETTTPMLENPHPPSALQNQLSPEHLSALMTRLNEAGSLKLGDTERSVVQTLLHMAGTGFALQQPESLSPV